MPNWLTTLRSTSNSRTAALLDVGIHVIILLNLVAFALETLPDLDPEFRSFLDAFEIFCVVVFTIEYVLRILATPQPLKFIFSFYGLIDLLAILPFYLYSVFDWRALRAFRVLRLIRGLRLVRFNKALDRFALAAKMVREEIILFLIVAFIVLYLTSAGMYYFENEAQPEAFASIFHSLWWAIVTLTTVGYGDIYPITVGGKIFTFFVLIIGVGIITIPAGLVASALTRAREIEDAGKADLEQQKKVD
ncbi:ion transporter [Robiginitalea sp.]|nr:ion transporter [Robiginitalea sp.]